MTSNLEKWSSQTQSASALLGRCSRCSPAEGAIYESLPGCGQLCRAHGVPSSLKVDGNGSVLLILQASSAAASLLRLLCGFGITSGGCMRRHFNKAFKHYFSPYLAKTETSARLCVCVCEESVLQNPTNAPPKYLPLWLICSHSQWLCLFFFLHFLIYLNTCDQNSWVLFLQMSDCMKSRVRRVRACASTCAVHARTVELFGILTTVPCWQLL